ncbi:MAG: cytochrome c [Candidatus Acidiferrales bacterium]|jgi:mono/diheme cytochrome c family protein
MAGKAARFAIIVLRGAPTASNYHDSKKGDSDSMNSGTDRDYSKGKGPGSILRGLVVLAIGLASIVAAYAGATKAARADDAKPTKTTLDGVFTEDQAKRGKNQYSQSCASCHMDDLSGSGQALPLAGDAFMQVWEGQTVDDLFELIQNTMPQDKPGTLTPEASLDIAAYLLQYNQFPSGKEELKNDPSVLKGILITKKAAH